MMRFHVALLALVLVGTRSDDSCRQDEDDVYDVNLLQTNIRNDVSSALAPDQKNASSAVVAALHENMPSVDFAAVHTNTSTGGRAAVETNASSEVAAADNSIELAAVLSNRSSEGRAAVDTNASSEVAAADNSTEEVAAEMLQDVERAKVSLDEAKAALITISNEAYMKSAAPSGTTIWCFSFIFVLALVIFVTGWRSAADTSNAMADAKAFMIKNFLILGLLTVITFGLIFPQPGLTLNTVKIYGKGLSAVAVSIIFVLSGLCLDSAQEGLVWKPMLIGIVLVLFVTPALAVPIVYLRENHPDLNPSLLSGMALFTIVPTTLSSGVTMITQAKGNVSLAIILTSVTNLLGVFTMPFSASYVFQTHVAIDPLAMLSELIWLTLVPLVFGVLLKQASEGLAKWAKKYKKNLSLSQNSCILFVVFLMISKAQSSITETSGADLGLCLSLAASVHLTYRILGYAVATAANLPPKSWVTIVLMCSQKSLPVCVSVLSALPAELQQNSGLYILPCIMAHAAQLIIDSMLAVRWEIKDESDMKAAFLPS